MNTAIIISGQTRTFRHVWRNQWWMVLRHFHDAHIFVSVTDDENAKDLELLLQRFPQHRVMVERINQPDCLDQLGLTEQTAMDYARGAPMTISTPPQGVLRQLWHLNRAWEFFKAQNGSSEFDVVMRLRPDLHFHRFAYNRGNPTPALNTCISPWWGGYGGINDRFAIMGADAAESYFTTYAMVRGLIDAGCPLHPESLVAAALGWAGVDSDRTLQSEFSAVRPNGQLVWPDTHLYDIINFQNENAHH